LAHRLLYNGSANAAIQELIVVEPYPDCRHHVRQLVRSDSASGARGSDPVYPCPVVYSIAESKAGFRVTGETIGGEVIRSYSFA
jgi:hypothetical protein